MPSRPGPVAFMSYVREDDDHEAGRLTTLRERLEGEVKMQTGSPFPIFQDRNDIEWGNHWKTRIGEDLDAVTFLIPIITPSFFQSAACRSEFEQFREREQEMGRADLILPIYYVEADEFSDEATRATDEMAQVLLSRQYTDWRDLRFEPLTSARVGQMLAGMAKQVKKALAGAPPRSAAPPKRRTTTKSASATTPPAPSVEAESRGPSPQTEPPTLVVDGMHRGDYTTLTEAVAAAEPGTRILVRPGYYDGRVVVNKPLEIVGDGPRDEITLRAEGANVVLFQTTMGRVANLTLRQEGGGKWYGVDITQGRLQLEDCSISSQSLACVAVHGSADPVVRRNRIHHGKQAGVFVFEGGRGTFEDNDIAANSYAGVEVGDEGDPVFRRNRIHDGKTGGVYIHENGRGTFEDNDIAANALAGVEVKEKGDPIFRRNRIHDGKQGGVYIHENGRGTFEDNDIAANALAGVEVEGEGDPVVRRNRIRDGKRAGVLVHTSGQGTFEDNYIWNNAGGAWAIRPDAGEVVRRDNVEEAPQGAA